jgi:HK97 gp10 family phage protein
MRVTANTAEIIKNIDRYTTNQQKQIAQVINNTALTMEREAKQLAPVDTGNLRSNIISHIAGINAEVVSGTEYSKYLEYGTSKIAARPFFTPSIEIARRYLRSNIGGYGGGS